MASALSNLGTYYDEAASLDVASLLPRQGEYSVSYYLNLTEHARKLAEFIDGTIEVLPMPTVEHQRIVFYLMLWLRSFAGPRGLGEALMSPLRLKLAENEFREPDVIFMPASKAASQINRYWEGASLVMEVVSEDNPQRDLVLKRRQYAAAGIAEYWIIDPRVKTISVLRLQDGQYVNHSQAVATGKVASALLNGFEIDAAAVFAAGEGK